MFGLSGHLFKAKKDGHNWHHHDVLQIKASKQQFSAERQKNIKFVTFFRHQSCLTSEMTKCRSVFDQDTTKTLQINQRFINASWKLQRFPSLPPLNLPPPHSLVETDTDLQLAVLRRVMKRRPAPVVGDDLAAVQQQPAEHLGVAAAGGEVHRRGTVAIHVREADLRETHLEGGGERGKGQGLG